MRNILLSLTLLLFAGAGLAQDDISQWLPLLKQDLRAQRKEILKKEMVTFTDEEAKRFWPIYDAYSSELDNFVDARVVLLKNYVDDYDTMTDVNADALLTRRLSIEKQRVALDEKYRPQFATALSPRRLLRFYQIEHQIDLMIDLQAVSQIPMMKWW
jgi:hypothetical protein